jgi:DNA-binding MarR family transcriptional regulator
MKNNSKGFLNLLLMRVSMQYFKRISKELRKIGLHRGQPRLLMLLGQNDGLSHTQIAEKLEIRPATTSTMIKRLEKKGLLIRKRSAVDERVSNVFLTKAGKDIQNQISDYLHQINDITFTGFSQDEKEILWSYFQRILENLSE